MPLSPPTDLLELVDDPTMVEATERLQAMYVAARAIVAARLEGRVAAAGDGTDEITPEEWDLIVAEHAGDVFGDAALDGVVAAAIITRALVSDRDLAELTARHQRSLSSYGPWVSQKVSRWVDEQVESGASTQEIVRRLGEDSPLSPDKAAFVADTEMVAAVNGGLVAGMTEAGVAAKRWVSMRDARVRPDHVAADGQTVPLGQDFNVGGWPAAYPGDPRLPIGERINCRCNVADVEGLFVRRAVAATKGDLYRTASEFGIVGRSTMNKGALQAAVLSHLCMQGLAGGADCPQTLHRMNRVALLAHARAAGIQGRHAMSRDDLVTALNDTLRGTDQFRVTHGYAPAVEMARFRKEVATVRRLAPRTDELAAAGALPPVAVRREARQAVFERHGGPERGYVPCVWCGLKVHPDPRNPGGFDALIPDPINAGAGFGVSNVLPACPGCFRARGEGGLRRAVFTLGSVVEQFINKNHDPKTGRFTGPGGAAGPGTPEDVKAGKAVSVKPEDAATFVTALDGMGDTDLTLVQIEGHPNLFADVAKNDVQRVAMPQIPKSHQAKFQAELEADGITIERVKIDPVTLSATQNELNGAKVSVLTKMVQDGTFTSDYPMWTSSDGKVLDGHHRWAAQSIVNVSNPAAAAPVDSLRVNLPMSELLGRANAFNDREGIARRASTGQTSGRSWQPKSLTSSGARDRTPHPGDSYDADVASFNRPSPAFVAAVEAFVARIEAFANPYHDPKDGRFTEKGGGVRVATRTVPAKKAAADQIAVMAPHEPGITANMQKLALENGGDLVGLDFRVKSQSSLARKIDDKVATTDMTHAEAAASMKDVIRYTALFPPDSFGPRAQGTVDTLRAQNASVNVKNSWGDTNNPYNGVNLQVTSRDGVKFEVQLHTADSFDMKENVQHKLYEQARKFPVGNPTRVRLEDEMLANARGMSVPFGALDVS